ncbi:MAG: response regulator transcription factor [Dongiaceae bacterium]
MMACNTVYVVDDNDAFRRSTQWLLESYGFRVECFGDGPTFVGSLEGSCDAPTTGSPACVLLDVRMPGMSGLEVQAALQERQLRLPVIFLTAHGDVPLAVEAMRRGAYSFLEKPCSDQELASVIEQAQAYARGDVAHPRADAEVKARHESLTARERQVLDLVTEGALNKTIADRLGISIKTVELHRSHVMEKMGAKSLAHLIRLTIQVQG